MAKKRTETETGPYSIFCITDTHFGKSSNNIMKYVNFTNYFKLFTAYVENNKAKDHDRDICIFCGDLFDNRNIIDIKVMSEVRSLVKRLSKIIKVYLIAGNHDQYERNNPIHTSLDLFEGEDPNLIVVKSPMLIKDNKILLMPFYNDNSAFISTVDKYSVAKTTNLLFCHASFTGNSFFTGPDSECVNTKDVSRFEKVVTGHIHSRNIYSNIHFVGAPYQLDFSDTNFDRGFDHFSINEEGHIVRDEFVKNTVSPVYVIRNVDSNEMFEDIITNCRDEFKGNYVKLIADRSVDYGIMQKDLSFLEAINIEWTLKKDMNLETTESTVDDRKYVSLSDEVSDYITGSNISDTAKTELISIVNDVFSRSGR